MYQVSDSFWEAIQSNNSSYSISGQITTDTEVINISDDNITGTLSIDRECVSGESHQFGCLSAAICKLSIITDTDRYGLYDKELTLFFTVDTAVGMETIPLGIWFITDAMRHDDVIDIEAVDNSLNFRIEVFENTVDYLYELLLFVCHTCGVPFGMSKQEVESLPNGAGYYSIDQTLVKTYAEVVEQAAKITATVPLMNREGQLIFVPYGINSRQDIHMDIVINDKVSDYEVYYTGITARMISNDQWTPISIGDETGLVMELGDISIASGLESTIEEYAQSLFSVISQVRYTPASLDLESNPVYDIGDKIMYRSGETVYIHRMIWKYDETGTIDCVGQNPRLKKKDDNFSKELSNLEQTISGKTVAVYKYTNASAITLKGGGTVPADMKEVIRIPFATTTDTTTLLMATVPFTMDTDGTVEFLTYIDAVYYDASAVRQYCGRGANVVTFMNYIDVAKNTRYMLQVYMRTGYEADSDIRTVAAGMATNANAASALLAAYNSQTAKLVAGINDSLSRIAAGYGEAAQAIMAASELPITGLPSLELPELSLAEVGYETVPVAQTVPTARIGAKAVKATIFGQGLAGREKWDGTLAFEELMGGYIPLGSVAVTKGFTVGIGTRTVKYEGAGLAESFGAIALGGMAVAKDMTAEYSITTQDVDSGG